MASSSPTMKHLQQNQYTDPCEGGGIFMQKRAASFNLMVCVRVISDRQLKIPPVNV